MIERRFLGWSAPALEAAAGTLLEHAAEGRWDLSVVSVVVPGARAGRLLLERLVGEAESRELALRPPEILSQGGLPERLYEPELPTPDPVLERLVWVEAARSTPSDALLRILPEPPPRGDDAGWDALAGTFITLHRELGAEGLTFEAVADRCAEGPGYNDEARWRVLAGVQARALSTLRRLGWMDRDEARRRALARFRAGAQPMAADRTLVLVGVAELPRLTRELLRFAAGDGAGRAGLGPPLRVQCLIHAPSDRADDFDALGCLIPEHWVGERLALPDDRLRVVDRPADQGEAVVARLAALEGRYAAEEITVGVPDADVIPYVEDRLRTAGLRTRVAAGRPVDRSSLFRLLEALSGWLRTGSYDDAAALLRHPAVEARLAREVPELADRMPEILDRFQSLHLQAVLGDPAHPGAELPSGGERRGDRFAVGVRAVLARLEGILEGRHPLTAWPERLRALLMDWLGSRPLRRGVPADRELLEAVGHLEGVLRGLESLPAEVDRVVEGTELLRFVLARLRDGAIAPPADGEAVELLGWLELHLDDAPVLVVTGVNEPHLPEAVTADPFLPNELRSRLGVADNRRRWARDLYRMRAILASRRELLLVAGRRGAAGDPLRLSRLLLAEEPEVVARRIRVALGEQREEEGVEDGGGEVPSGSGATSPILLPPEPELRMSPVPDSMSVTGFRAFLRDSYAFGLEHWRGLEAVEDGARELDPMGFGNLAHAVLEGWGKLEGADRMSVDEVEEAMDEVLDGEARDRFGRRPLPAVRIQVELLRVRLRAVARVQGRRNDTGWRIRSVEARPPKPGVRFPVDGEDFFLRGRIDRIDEHPEQGVIQLLDFKTSSKAKAPDRVHRAGRGDARRWVDLQLPLYRHLAGAMGFGEGTGFEDGTGREVQMGYFSVPADVERTGVAVAEWGPEELAEADETAREVIRELRRGVVRWDPEASRIRVGDPLGAVVGAGTLRLGGNDA